MSRMWPLLLRMALCVAAALALVGVCALTGLRLALPLPIAVGLVAGALLWVAQIGVPPAERLSAPDLELDPGYALPHAQDQRVRRLEDLIYSAQPHRRMTSRGLMRMLGEIAEDRSHDPDLPELSRDLRSRIAESGHPDAENHPVAPVDRRTLHRYLRELSRRSH